MNRREFLHATAFSLAATALAPAQEYDRDKRRRVGLIGCGWYGKSDLFRVVQISPVYAMLTRRCFRIRRDVRRPAAFQEEASHILGQSKDACRAFTR
jgi:hypothetical protein